MRRKVFAFLGVGFLTSLLVLVAAQQVSRPLPNIIFIMADDLGYGDPHCYNAHSKVPTPNLDRLAREGMRFTDAHTAASVCTPSRYGVLTGRYCWRTYLKSQVLWTTFDEPLIEPERMTVASLARKYGYRTACIGKWHLGMNFYKKTSDEFARGKTWHENGRGGCRDVDFSRDAAYSPNDVGFDFSFISGAGHNMEPFCFIRDRRPLWPPTEWREANIPTLPGSSARESHEGWMSPGWTDEMVDVMFTRQAVRFIERSVKEDPARPFFLYFTPVAPHRPCVPVNKFRGVTGTGLREDFAAEYDWEVGRVLEVLDSLGIADKTLLIVTSDNGAVEGGPGQRSNGLLRGRKTSLFEGGHRVPFLVRWPSHVKAGSVNDTPVALTGLLATMAELFGEKLPDNAGEDSFSFLGTLLGKEDPSASPPLIIHHSYGGRFAVRYGEWKLLPVQRMLFNISNDPYEKNNVYKEHPDIVRQLLEILLQSIEEGRSTPGAPQKNAPPRKGEWRQYEELKNLAQELGI